jgi:murein DD-endopeptidase MepM/ murein hydrolase activator NlpD
MTATADDLPELSSPRQAVRVRSFMYRRSDTHHHRGIDLPAAKGTPVYAARGGRIVYASNRYLPGFSGYGRVVVVHADDGTFQLYAHLNGAKHGTYDGEPQIDVSAGQLLGWVGNSVFTRTEPNKESGGAHLHFEVSATKYPQQSEAPRIDPVPYLRSGNVHPLTGQRLGSSSAATPPPNASTPTEGSPSAVAPFGQSHFSHCPCCGQPLPIGKGKCDDHEG